MRGKLLRLFKAAGIVTGALAAVLLAFWLASWRPEAALAVVFLLLVWGVYTVLPGNE